MCFHFPYIQSEFEKEWLAEKYENLSSTNISKDTKLEILELITKSQTWDNFLATKFPTVKRYGGEGAESMLAFFREIFVLTAESKITFI